MKNLITPLAAGAVLLLAAASSNAAIIITAQNGVTGTFGVSNTDLGQAAGTTLTLDSGAAAFGSSVGKLNDGDVYGLGADVETVATLTPTDGSVTV